MQKIFEIDGNIETLLETMERLSELNIANPHFYTEQT